MDIDQWVSELGRFADLDFPVNSTATNQQWIARFRQKSLAIEIALNLDKGTVIERREEIVTRHSSYRGLLASQHFGDLQQLARMQIAILQKSGGKAEFEEHQIHVAGEMEGPGSDVLQGTLVERVDSWGEVQEKNVGVRALVIDGPAGIGKTHLIRSLVHRRAKNFGPNGRPLVLHIQSRGRQLTTLPDLLAGTLQTMRLALTYEQVPVLAHHNLLQVAIDGFDELADPNGYENAWHSLRDFIADMRGKGVLILAGRDTFIDAASVQRALKILSSNAVVSVHLRPTLLAEAVSWLKLTGLSEQAVRELEGLGLLEVGSYALRPFFLRKIREVAISSGDLSALTTFPLGTLVDAMVARESPLVESLKLGISEAELTNLLHKLFCEIAREMADLESDSIDVDSLQLVAEIVFDSRLAEEPLRALRNRIKSIALLDTDLLPNRRRFVHSEVHAYFLAHAYIQLLASEEIELARSLRRNILGSDFLEVFHDVFQCMGAEMKTRFHENARQLLRSRLGDDRARTNIGALLLASLDGTQPTNLEISIEDIVFDEALLRGTVGYVKLVRASISKLDVRETNISEMVFEESTIFSLLVDSGTLLPANVPQPRQLTLDDDGQQRLFDPVDIQTALAKLTIKSPATGVKTSFYMESEAGKLFDKLCRAILRQTWIRTDDDYGPSVLLRHPSWPQLRTTIADQGFLEERGDFSAGGNGKKSNFLRIRRAREFLDVDSTDKAIVSCRMAIAKLQ